MNLPGATGAPSSSYLAVDTVTKSGVCTSGSFTKSLVSQAQNHGEAELGYDVDDKPPADNRFPECGSHYHSGCSLQSGSSVPV